MGYAEENKACERVRDFTTIVELSCECLETDARPQARRLWLEPSRLPGAEVNGGLYFSLMRR